jgi:hypothetical protein
MFCYCQLKKVLLNKTELIRTGKKELDTDGIAYNLNDIIEYATII